MLEGGIQGAARRQFGMRSAAAYDRARRRAEAGVSVGGCGTRNQRCHDWRHACGRTERGAVRDGPNAGGVADIVRAWPQLCGGSSDRTCGDQSRAPPRGLAMRRDARHADDTDSAGARRFLASTQRQASRDCNGSHRGRCACSVASHRFCPLGKLCATNVYITLAVMCGVAGARPVRTQFVVCCPVGGHVGMEQCRTCVMCIERAPRRAVSRATTRGRAGVRCGVVRQRRCQPRRRRGCAAGRRWRLDLRRARGAMCPCVASRATPRPFTHI